MKTSPQKATTGHERETARARERDSSTRHARRPTDDAAPLPHESDQNPTLQHDEALHRVGKQAHRDVERGLKDTDRWGGDEYQQRTQNDAHANENSASERGGAARHRHKH
ncbi:MAG TPA: hypothetical protein VEI25_04470 [Paraburkholderia sp.]|nr:hypothetical protein [Paraburkholderia sp.]